MPSRTNEQALEASIQEKLSGLILEKIKEKDRAANVAEESEQYRSGSGYFPGDTGNFNARYVYRLFAKDDAFNQAFLTR